MKRTFVLLAALIVAGPLFGRWGTCQAGGRPAPVCRPAEPTFEWRQIDAEQWSLRYGGIQVGAYVVGSGRYYVLDRGTFATTASKPPVSPPAAAVKQVDVCLCPNGGACDCKDGDCRCGKWCRCELCPGNAAKPPDQVRTVQGDTVPTGVDTQEISPREKFTLNGVEVPRPRAFEAVGGTIPDYKSKPWLVPIGTKDQRERILKDLESHPLKGEVLVKDYDPAEPRESWALEPGFKRDGALQLYGLAPDGGVFARVDKYVGPQTLTALRKAVPGYEPEKDPDPTKPASPLAPLQSVPWSVYAVGGLAALAFLFPRK